MATKRDYYDVLGVQKGASADEIKKRINYFIKKNVKNIRFFLISK